VPGYQTAAVPGMGSVARRSVADVAFNADPSTGQYVAVMSPGSSAINWLSVGGTSLSTPQWAGLVAMANAQRSLAAKPALGAPHAVLYGQVGAVPGTYAAAFADINKGANGSCSGCAAKAGYDTPSGLGTPNVNALLSALSGTSTVSAAPVVSSANVSGTAGTALSFTVSVVAPNPVTYTLIAAPSGMAIGTTGVVSWAKPVAGTYSVGVVAKDAKTGLTGQGVYTLQIGAATVSGPVITAPAMTGVAGKKLVGTISISAPGATGLSVSISGVPSGMGFSVSGLAFTATWASPVVGAYSLKVVAVDSNGKTASANVPITITAK